MYLWSRSQCSNFHISQRILLHGYEGGVVLQTAMKGSEKICHGFTLSMVFRRILASMVSLFFYSQYKNEKNQVAPGLLVAPNSQWISTTTRYVSLLLYDHLPHGSQWSRGNHNGDGL